ncbi:hypothetical protein [Psychroflexus aestuariivivens]|uniref:hypothetical protein n=1 Tax=Psychroflexus aestuariivivens TaxID=1795040 RepID=UPI000FD96FD7|nr:hypothetical protein [Psychroflexus aestuariivivens]
MKLYIHIGTEKTGSSFLQSYLAKNRQMLAKHGVHFPEAGLREADMLSGKISPGNASELNTLLSQKSWAKVEQWLKMKYKATKNNNCNQLLLSNEILVKTFSGQTTLSNFIKVASDQGFELQPLLLIIRDPVGQALSLYKHRSKNGDMMPIHQWLREKYNLAHCIRNFYQNIEDLNVVLNQYAYQKNSKYLVDLCINKWMGLDEQITIEHTSVNPSLTLSELKLMSQIKVQNAYLSNMFYKQMIEIPDEQKSDESNLKSFYKDVIAQHLVKYQNVWEMCNINMTNGQISIPKNFINKNFVNQTSVEYSFTEVQLTKVSELMSFASSKTFLKQKTNWQRKQKFKKLLPNQVVKAIVNFCKN